MWNSVRISIFTMIQLKIRMCRFCFLIAGMGKGTGWLANVNSDQNPIGHYLWGRGLLFFPLWNSLHERNDASDASPTSTAAARPWSAPRGAAPVAGCGSQGEGDVENRNVVPQALEGDVSLQLKKSWHQMLLWLVVFRLILHQWDHLWTGPPRCFFQRPDSLCYFYGFLLLCLDQESVVSAFEVGFFYDFPLFDWSLQDSSWSFWGAWDTRLVQSFDCDQCGRHAEELPQRVSKEQLVDHWLATVACLYSTSWSSMAPESQHEKWVALFNSKIATWWTFTSCSVPAVPLGMLFPVVPRCQGQIALRKDGAICIYRSVKIGWRKVEDFEVCNSEVEVR